MLGRGDFISKSDRSEGALVSKETELDAAYNVCILTVPERWQTHAVLEIYSVQYRSSLYRLIFIQP